ncbi:MAG: ABC transporter ATP-binding protein/permease [Bacillota bacterium]
MKKINLEFSLGEFVAVTGESGSGKSTLLNVISGLDGYEDGELFLFGEETSHYTIADWEKYRGTYIGFVFQNYNIIDSYTVLQNVLLALEIQGYDPKLRRQRALELIEKVGLTSHKNHKASKLSGGQKQRAVIARALAKDCPTIVADEPTGNLDSASGTQIMKLLHDISKGKLVVVVTHEYELVEEYATRKIKMHDGEVVEDKKIKTAEIAVLNEIPQPKRMNFLTLLRFAVRNLLATPKKLIFLMLMQILVIAVFTLVYTNQISNVREIGLEQSFVYPSVPETRLLIEKRDGTEFTDAELTYFTNLRQVNYVYENAMNFYNQNQLMINSSGGYGYGYIEGTDTALMLSPRDIDGRLPLATNEVVISSYYDSFSIGDTIHLTMGDYWYSSDSQDHNLLGTFTVVGIDKQERRIIYFSDAFLQMEYIDQELIDNNKYYISLNNIQWSMYMTYLSSPIYLEQAYEPQSVDIVIFGDGNRTTLTDQTLVFSTRSASGQVLTKTVTEVSLSVPEVLATYAYATINETLLTSIVDDFMELVKSEYTITPSNIISLSVDGYYAGNRVINNVDSSIYKVYYPANISGILREFLVFFAGLMALVFLSLFGMFLYSIVHAVTRNVMNARKKDFAIYRSIGANKTSLARLVVLEQVLMSTIGFIITIILLRIVSTYVGFIKLSIQYMENQDYAILLAAFMLFGAWLGLRFNKKVFKQSVIETLSASREE